MAVILYALRDGKPVFTSGPYRSGTRDEINRFIDYVRAEITKHPGCKVEPNQSLVE